MTKDEIRNELAVTGVRVKTITAVCEAMTERDELIKENIRLSKQLAEQSIKLLMFNEVVTERDELKQENGRLREELTDLRQSIIRVYKMNNIADVVAAVAALAIDSEIMEI